MWFISHCFSSGQAPPTTNSSLKCQEIALWAAVKFEDEFLTSEPGQIPRINDTIAVCRAAIYCAFLASFTAFQTAHFIDTARSRGAKTVETCGIICPLGIAEIGWPITHLQCA